MQTLPSRTLVLHDANGAPFGVLRLAPSEDNPLKGECIFDVHPASAEQGARTEVRWLYKRRFKRFGEHKFKVADGSVTITGADFTVVLDPTEDGPMQTRPPAPRVTAAWA